MAYAAGAAGTALAPVAPVEIEYPRTRIRGRSERRTGGWECGSTGNTTRRGTICGRRQGLELIGGRYQRLPAEELADGTLRLESKVLGLEVRQEEERLRFYDPATGSYLLSSAEEQQGRLRAEQRWQQAEEDRQLEAAARRQAEAAQSQAEARLHDEAAARRQAEARIAALEALLRERGENDTPGR